jgi:hypothetical protein
MKYNFLILALLTILISSCAITHKSERQAKYSIQAGANKGGITENTDLSEISGLDEADAFTGATTTGFNVGIHINKPLNYGELEFGLDYMKNFQSFVYSDNANNNNGTRNLYVNQFMIPLTYNFLLFENSFPELDFQFKIGILNQVNFIQTENFGLLPFYKTKFLSTGAIMGISVYPFKLSETSKLGFFADIYRGSQIYTDLYNQEKFEMPGSSFMKAGIRYQF